MDELQALQKIEIAESILRKRDEAVKFRATSGIERQWSNDEATLMGGELAGTNVDVTSYASGEEYPGKSKGQRRSKAEVNIVRGRCEVAEGRFCEIALPTEDKNWGLKVTPIPELDDLEKDKRPAYQNNKPIQKEKDGQLENATLADVATEKRRLAIEKMKKMEAVIDDQLVECDYNSELRKVIRNAIRLGTGILKGPNIVKRVYKKWVEAPGGFELKVVEDLRPYSISVSPWRVYPAPNCYDNIKNAQYVWEYDLISPRELRSLADIPTYDEQLINEILRTEPLRTDLASLGNKEERKRVELGNDYEKWEYYGPVDREDLEFLGCSCEGVQEGMEMLSASIVFVNDKPIRVFLNPLDTGDNPYDFFRWTEIPDSPWGVGIPRQMFWLQRIMNAAWRETMNNAGDSSGANVVIGDGIEPADKVMEVTGKKLWYYTGKAYDDVRKAIHQFQIESRQEPLERIMDLVLKFTDLETGMPTVFQGEQQKMPETLGATNIVVDSSNVSLRWRVKLFDDDITDPHITRYYHYNMQHHDDDEIKGDYAVDARGTSVLLERDAQHQGILQAWQLKGDPDFKFVPDWTKLAKQYMRILRLDAINTDEEIEKLKKAEAQNQQANLPPEMQVARLRAETELEKEKMRSAREIEKMKFERQEAAEERAYRQKMAEMEMNKEILRLANEQQLKIDDIKAKLAETSVKINAQKEMSAAKAVGPQIAEPAIEPAGRAPDGQAFQK